MVQKFGEDVGAFTTAALLYVGAAVVGCMDLCLAISGWIDAPAEQALRQSEWFQHFQVLSTEACFNDWVRNGNPPAHTYPV